MHDYSALQHGNCGSQQMTHYLNLLTQTDENFGIDWPIQLRKSVLFSPNLATQPRRIFGKNLLCKLKEKAESNLKCNILSPLRRSGARQGRGFPLKHDLLDVVIPPNARLRKTMACKFGEAENSGGRASE
ncbi:MULTISPECIES: hypothetical protein [Variovorax]|jgi:hypothetical protein|uniref:hypothetical protein n=1 Tax=Variovorax TaxID=34072 RepID=UPI00115F7F5C|nr:hypothetical protein [Variovorax sp. OV084]